MDAFVVQIMDKITEYGWAVQGVFGTDGDPSCFSYTVGLTSMDKPELFLDALNPRQATGVLNAVATRVRDNALDPALGGTFDAEFSCPFQWRGPIDPEWAEANLAHTIYGEITLFQVLWPDVDGLFPTDSGYNVERFPQRLMPLA